VPQVKALNGTSWPLLDIVTKTLDYVKTEALKEAGRSLPYGLQAEDVQWVLTVPAIWKDGAKGFMRKAAHRAGLIKEEGSRRLVLALEPESACVACDVHKLAKPGDPFMVLDCGGGTVDITMNTCAPSPELPRALEPERLVPRASQAAQREPFAPR
jgi:molecular chaperone DnaK (HSP70)